MEVLHHGNLWTMQMVNSILNKHGTTGCKAVDGSLFPSHSHSKASLLMLVRFKWAGTCVGIGNVGEDHSSIHSSMFPGDLSAIPPPHLSQSVLIVQCASAGELQPCVSSVGFFPLDSRLRPCLAASSCGSADTQFLLLCPVLSLLFSFGSFWIPHSYPGSPWPCF